MDMAQEVFKREHLMDFWPSDRQTAKERVEATTRFIVYAVAILFVIRRDPRVVLLGGLVLVVLYGLYFNNMIPEGARAAFVSKGLQGFTMPTVDNPMGNILLGEDPNRSPAAWYPSVREEVQKDFDIVHPFEKVRDYDRNFYTTASTTIPNDQAAFAQAAYGRPFAPQCRDTPGACDPDGNPYSTFPERSQLRGGNGTR
jgi:hypothetical protein